MSASPPPSVAFSACCRLNGWTVRRSSISAPGADCPVSRHDGWVRASTPSTTTLSLLPVPANCATAISRMTTDGPWNAARLWTQTTCGSSASSTSSIPGAFCTTPDRCGTRSRTQRSPSRVAESCSSLSTTILVRKAAAGTPSNTCTTNSRRLREHRSRSRSPFRQKRRRLPARCSGDAPATTSGHGAVPPWLTTFSKMP